MRRTFPTVLLVLCLAACGDDPTPAATAPSPVQVPAAVEADLAAGAEQYRSYVLGEVAGLRTAARTLTDAVRAGDLEGARAAYAPSRVGWERIEPIAGVVEELDGRLDARVDDFAGVDDPAFTGWHRLEHLLFERGTTDGGAPFADQLDADLVVLERELAEVPLTPLDVARGAGELVEEVTRGKITGEEDRYAHTDLWDFAANLEGSAAAVEALRPALQAQDPTLLEEVEGGLRTVLAGLEPYEVEGGGYRPYDALTDADRQRLGAQLAALSEELSEVPGVLGLA